MRYQSLIVWQKSLKLAEEIYHLTEDLPNAEKYGLADQMRRAAVSVPSNIAEGAERESVMDYTRFLTFAKGSVAELETQLILCKRIGYLPAGKTDPILVLCGEIKRILKTMILKFKTKKE